MPKAGCISGPRSNRLRAILSSFLAVAPVVCLAVVCLAVTCSRPDRQQSHRGPLLVRRRYHPRGGGSFRRIQIQVRQSGHASASVLRRARLPPRDGAEDHRGGRPPAQANPHRGNPAGNHADRARSGAGRRFQRLATVQSRAAHGGTSRQGYEGVGDRRDRRRARAAAGPQGSSGNPSRRESSAFASRAHRRQPANRRGAPRWRLPERPIYRSRKRRRGIPTGNGP